MEFGEVRTFVTAASFLHAFSFTIFKYAVYEPVCLLYERICGPMLCHCPCSKFSIKFYLFIYLFIYFFYL